MTTGERIRAARLNAGLTQRALAEKCGIAAGTVQQYERGVRQPRIGLLVRIAIALGVRLEDLTGTETFESGAEFDKAWNERAERMRRAKQEEQNRLCAVVYKE